MDLEIKQMCGLIRGGPRCSPARRSRLRPGASEPQRVVGTAEEIAKTQRRSDWRRPSAGAGTKGPRLHDRCYLELADLEGEESNHHSQVLWTRGLLIRRNIANGDLAYFTTWCSGPYHNELSISDAE